MKCEIGREKLRGHCDLGASINHMPLSVFKRLKIGELKPTSITLAMADKSRVIPVGVVENVLIKVEHLVFPVDFVVIEMSEDDIPLILGRPFLATSHVQIDAYKGHLTLQMGDEPLLVRVFEQEDEDLDEDRE